MSNSQAMEQVQVTTLVLVVGPPCRLTAFNTNPKMISKKNITAKAIAVRAGNATIFWFRGNNNAAP